MSGNVITHSKPWITTVDVEAVEKTLHSGMIAYGAKVSEFEFEVGKFLGIGAGVATKSGTSALALALLTLGIDLEDEVILPTYVCKEVLDSVRSIGAVPIICDTNEFGVLTPDTIRPYIGKNTKAIIAVHIFGYPCDIESLQVFGVPIIEDACQSFGLMVRGKMAGTLGEIGVLSFHATKCLTTGEGGMLVSSDEQLLRRARSISDKQTSMKQLFHAPLTDMQAALGLSQLSRYPEFLIKRRTIAARYDQVIGLNFSTVLQPKVNAQLFRYTFRSSIPYMSLRKYFGASGIEIRRGVDALLHRFEGLPEIRFVQATQLFQENISIPFYPALTDDEVARICSSLEGMTNVS
jgi:UDP-4-amino-4-deoxy-L-arabinose-oxoglutarate aminotransferase